MGQESAADDRWSDMAMLAVAGAVVGAAIGYNTKKARKVSACGNSYCTSATPASAELGASAADR